MTLVAAFPGRTHRDADRIGQQGARIGCGVDLGRSGPAGPGYTGDELLASVWSNGKEEIPVHGASHWATAAVVAARHQARLPRGHPGASGSLGFADPEHRLAFGYTPNLWAELSGSFTSPKFRFHALTEAVSQCAGVRIGPRPGHDAQLSSAIVAATSASSGWPSSTNLARSASR